MNIFSSDEKYCNPEESHFRSWAKHNLNHLSVFNAVDIAANETEEKIVSFNTTMN